MLIVYTIVALLIAYRTTDVFLGRHYVCPRCGARSANRHANDCPWNH